MTSAVDDRRRAVYENATSLSQAVLDESFRGGENQIEAIAILTKTLTRTFTVTIASPGVFTCAAHGLTAGQSIVLSTTGALPTGILAAISYFVINPTTDTFKVSLTLGGSAINTSGSQSGVHTLTYAFTLRFADRPKFVGDYFYEGRCSFPQVKRTIGDPLSPSIQFSAFEVVLGNIDGFYNQYLANGANYFSFIGAKLTVQIGLRDVQASFITVFEGFVPEDDGFEVQRQTIIIRATDRFNDLNRRSPLPSINATDFPSAPADVIGKIIPMVLGDWEAGFNITDDTGTLDINDGASDKTVRIASPSGFYGGTVGYYVGGGFFVFSIGTYTPDNVSACYIKRGDTLFMTNFDAAPDNTAGYWSVHVDSLKVPTGAAAAYQYQNGDVAVIKVKVPYSPGNYSNVIEIARQMLYTLAGKTSADLNMTAWNAIAAKSSPAQSAFTSILGRIWVGDDKDTVLGLVLGLLEQVRIEMFIDSDGLIKITTLHPEDFPAVASATRIDQAEINEEKVTLKADDKTFINQGWINFGYTPVTNKTELSTVQKKNQNSIEKSGKTVVKIIDCPNLYVEADAEKQLIEFLRFYSAGLSFLDVEVAWVHLLRDLGQFVAFNYDIGSLDYVEKPMMIRDIGVNLAMASVTFKLLSFTNFPYANYSPTNSARMLSSDAQAIVDA